MSYLLQATRVNKHFGGVRALRDAHLELSAGEVHALMGENGAGKSTLAKVLAGSVRPDTATIAIEGRPVSIASPLDAQRLGIGIIYQELDLFPNLTAGENLVIGNLRFRERGLVNFRRMETFCRPFLDQVGLPISAHRPVASLSIGERQLLAIARALAMNARILLMDEPTSSLFEDGVERLFRLIAGLKQRGVSIVYVSHKMDEILRISGRVTVMRDGETIRTLDTASTTANEIIQLMVGRQLNFAARADRAPAGHVVLAVSNLTTGKLKQVSFELHRGEVLGVAGLVGSGRSELGAALFGMDPIRAGSIRVHGEPFQPRSVRDSIRRGIGLLPEDRRVDGLMMQMSFQENATLAILDRLERLGFLSAGREQRAVEALLRRLSLDCPPLATPINTLSGGNQQRALLARWLLLNPRILFLDDPTRGIDVRSKQDIYRLIAELASGGMGIVLVSSELPELLLCSDRILVMNGGCLAAAWPAAEATQGKIMAAATSGGIVS